MSDVSNGGVPKTQLTVNGILNDLNEGLTRPQIAAKYNLSGRDMKDLFSHEKLKGRKTKPAPSFVLIDDTVDVVVPTEAVIEEVAEAIGENITTENVEVGEEF